jgi:hypothetical protein
MSRSVSTSTLAILLFFTLFAIFTSAAPTNPTNSTVDGTNDDSGVLDKVNTLATSATHSGTVRRFRDRQSMTWHAHDIPLYLRWCA